MSAQEVAQSVPDVFGEWQPIESAPTDGELVLIAPHMMVAWWEFGDNNWQVMHVPLNEDKTIAYDWAGKAKLWFCISATMLGAEPTHWMPLPANPTLHP